LKKSTSFRRHYLIIELLRRRRYVSFNDFQEHLANHDIEISPRTLQRDFNGIRADYQIDIPYSATHKGYYIKEDTSIPIDDFLHFMEVVSFSELMIENLNDVREANQYIQFESTENLKGVHQLKDILFAIRNKRIIKFKHENFHTGKSKDYSLNPMLIKEYQKRWYVVGTIESNEIRTFGIDRISDLELTEKVFKTPNGLNVAENFSRAIGIVYEGDREEVILSFNPLQGKYIKTLPLHHSQQIIIDNEQEFRISLDVIVNFELIQRILMYGPNVKVIAPATLQKQIKDSLTETLSLYKKI
jgi:predicted DNA-binding transcriptional regulator YafY